MFSSINLTLYTQDDCGYCHLLKKKLAEWDFRYREINVSYDLFAKDFMKAKGLPPSVFGVACFYKDLVNYLMVDLEDKSYEKKIRSLGICPIYRNIKMNKKTTSINMAKSILRLLPSE